MIKKPINTVNNCGSLFFSNDCFDSYKEFGMQLLNVLKNSSYYKKKPIYDGNADGFSLAINSSWGTGKTTFLYRLCNELNATAEFKAIYYNAWECDGYQNALIPALYHIRSLIESSMQNIKPKRHFLYYISKAISQTPVTATTGAIGFRPIPKDFIDAVKKIIKRRPIWQDADFFESFHMFLESKKSLSEAFIKCNIKPKKLVVIVDELDRCKPSFAIETLEFIKHYFNIDNIMFVFALDISQLSCSIENLYGSRVDSTGYLRRFFDLHLSLPPINFKSFISNFLSNITLVRDNVIKRSETAEENLSELKDNAQLIECLCQLSQNLNLSLRDIEKFLAYLILLCQTSFKSFEVYGDEHLTQVLSIYYYLIVIVSKYPDLWRLLTTLKNISETKINDYIYKKEYSIFPARYYFDEDMQPKIVSNFCRKILLSYPTLNCSVLDLNDYDGNKNPLFAQYLFLKGDNSVLDSIKKNLAIIPSKS